MATASHPLYIHGTEDASTNPRCSKDLIAALGSEDKALMPIKGGRHSLLDDTDPVKVCDTVLDWLE